MVHSDHRRGHPGVARTIAGRGGAAYGATYPGREFFGVAVVSVIGAWAFGFGADVIASLTGTAVTIAIVGAVSGFVHPRRPAPESNEA